MRLSRNALMVLFCGLTLAVAQTSPKKQIAKTPRIEKAAKRSKVPLISANDGLAVLSAALDARTRLAAKADCSHLVHDIYERAGFLYSYADSNQLYKGSGPFYRVTRPQPGDLVVWPGHVGIVVNPAQRSFFSSLSSGLDVDRYDSTYWKERGQPRFLRFVKTSTLLKN
jgi:cell wall-associated NlpC family hydrolase